MIQVKQFDCRSTDVGYRIYYTLCCIKMLKPIVCSGVEQPDYRSVIFNNSSKIGTLTVVT